MTTTGRPPDQPQQPQTPTSGRPDGDHPRDRSAPAVARIQGYRAHGFLVDELVQFQPGGIVELPVHVELQAGHLYELRIALARITQPLEQLTAIWADIVETVRPALDLLADQPPADPKARALWLRQHRNTGPTQPRQRAPRTLGRTR